MASSYLIQNRKEATYIVKVSKIGRGHKIVSKKEFRDYEEAMAHMDRMEALHSTDHIVEFDTKWG